MIRHRFALVISRYHSQVMEGMLQGAKTFFEGVGSPISNEDIFDAPGAFEIPLIAQTIAETGRYQGVVCLGCVIKGETAHFEYISQATAMGIMQAGLQSGVPVSFGVLTVLTEEQALERSKANGDNKGLEAARACYESAELFFKLR